MAGDALLYLAPAVSHHNLRYPRIFTWTRNAAKRRTPYAHAIDMVLTVLEADVRIGVALFYLSQETVVGFAHPRVLCA